jgi:hypothetical protein
MKIGKTIFAEISPKAPKIKGVKYISPGAKTEKILASLH